MVSQFPYDLSQFGLIYCICVELLPHLSDLHLLTADLHLLDAHYQEESQDRDDEEKHPEPEAKPWSSILFHHGDFSISRTGHRANAT